MGAITKTFIVLNMVFSIAFVTVAGVVLAHREDWRDKYVKLEQQKATELKQMKEQRDSFQVQLENANVKLVQMRSKVDALEGANQTLTREKTNQADRARAAEERADKADARAQAKDAQARLTDAEKDKALRELADARDQVNKARAQVDAHLTTMVGLRGTISSLRRKEKELLHRLEGSTQDNERYATAMAFVRKQDPSLYVRAWGGEIDESPVTVIRAAVAAVDNQMNLIVLNKGASSSPPVKKGYHFWIHRGREFVARVKVVRVDEGVAAAEVIEPRTDLTPRVGDDARSEY
jgi:TolA-binding protein